MAHRQLVSLSRQTALIFIGLACVVGLVSGCSSGEFSSSNSSRSRRQMDLDPAHRWRAERERRQAAIERTAARRQETVRESTRTVPLATVSNQDDRTRWQNPEPGLAAACSPTTLNVRACIGVNRSPRAVLIESNLYLLAGDPVSVDIGGRRFTTRAQQDMGNAIWIGAEAERMIAALRAGSEALITHTDGVQFRVSLRGSAAAIRRALR